MQWLVLPFSVAPSIGQVVKLQSHQTDSILLRHIKAVHTQHCIPNKNTTREFSLDSQSKITCTRRTSICSNAVRKIDHSFVVGTGFKMIPPNQRYNLKLSCVRLWHWQQKEQLLYVSNNQREVRKTLGINTCDAWSLILHLWSRHVKDIWSVLTSSDHFILQIQQRRENEFKFKQQQPSKCKVYSEFPTHLFGLGHTLHVGRGNAGAGQSLSSVLLIAFQNLTL